MSLLCLVCKEGFIETRRKRNGTSSNRLSAKVHEKPFSSCPDGIRKLALLPKRTRACSLHGLVASQTVCSCLSKRLKLATASCAILNFVLLSLPAPFINKSFRSKRGTANRRWTSLITNYPASCFPVRRGGNRRCPAVGGLSFSAVQETVKQHRHEQAVMVRFTRKTPLPL